MTLDELAAFGANVEEGLARCMGNEAIYLRLVGMMKDEAAFDTLGEALEENDLEKAFGAAHALKGVLGNLSLTPIYEPVQEITELLRARTEMDYGPLYGEITRQRDALNALL